MWTYEVTQHTLPAGQRVSSSAGQETQAPPRNQAHIPQKRLCTSLANIENAHSPAGTGQKQAPTSGSCAVRLTESLGHYVHVTPLMFFPISTMGTHVHIHMAFPVLHNQRGFWGQQYHCGTQDSSSAAPTTLYSKVRTEAAFCVSSKRGEKSVWLCQ